MDKAIRTRERDAIIQSLRAGVTPRMGLQHIQVGRINEVEALIRDLDRMQDGGATFRLVVGDFGSGKSFFLQLTRTIALEKGFVTVHADLSPDRRLQASGGQAKNLYNELMRNMSTRTKADGNALKSVVEKFITLAIKKAESEDTPVLDIIHAQLFELEELVGGYDFARVIGLYYQGYEEHDERLQNDCVRWLRGEFATKTDARTALGVRTIVDDSHVYDYLKLWSVFVRQAGYQGILVNIDELVNLYKLPSRQARTTNYEQILRILNDCLQGTAHSIGFLLGGTPEFLFDPRKGLYSYEALRSRLAENAFAKQTGLVDYNAPTLHLDNLKPEELYILLKNIRYVFNQQEEMVSDDALQAFLAYCHEKIGEAYFRTPRNTVKAFVDLLSLLEQNPQLSWQDLIQDVNLSTEINTDMPPLDQGEDEEDLATFKL